MTQKDYDWIQSMLDYWKRNVVEHDKSPSKNRSKQLLIDLQLIEAHNLDPEFADFSKQIEEIKKSLNKE